MEAEQASSAQEDTSKRGTLESLSKEELIRKCKGLLGLAQKAKKAKDEHAEENKKLKDDLAIFQTQKEADKKSLMAMKEMVEAFTDDKIKLTSQIADLKRFKRIHDEQQESFKEYQAKLENISIENESLKRQIQRLTDENEELLSNLDKMEKKLEQVNTFGLQQQKDLILLEKEASKWANLQKSYVDLQNQFKDISKENEGLQIIISSLREEKSSTNVNESLKNQISQLTNENVNLRKEVQEKCDELATRTQTYEDYAKRNQDTLIQLENAKDVERKYKSRLQTFKSKLIEVTLKLNRLTKTKEILLETVKEYSESVPKWQKELCNASKHLFSYITYLNEAKYQLETEIEKIRKSLMESESSKDFYENKLQELMKCCKTVILEFELKSQELEKLRSCDDNMNLGTERYEDESRCEDNTQLTNLQQEFDRRLQTAIAHTNNLETCLNLEKTCREEIQQRLEQAERFEKDSQCVIEFYEKKFDELLHCCSEALIEFDEKYCVLEQAKIKTNMLNKSTNTELDSKENVNLILQLETDLNQQKSTLDAVLSEKKELERCLHLEKESKESLENSLKGYKENINNLQLNKDFFELKLNDLLKYTTKALEEFELRSEKSDETNATKENFLEMEEKCKTLMHEIELLTSEKNKLETEKQFYIEMEKNLVKCKDELTNLNADKDISLNKKDETIQRLKASLSVRETKNADLLAEMRELNEALKGRGDVISRQQDKIKELEQEIKRVNDLTSILEQNTSEKDEKINSMTSELRNKESEINNLQKQTNQNEKTIRNLSEEVSSMRDKPQEQQQMETLSTSTISKVEEQTSLREVEESLEERYQKLRALAIKLKKRVQEQSAQIVNLEIERDANCSEKTETDKELGTLNNQVKNLQALQAANDKLQDEIDKYKSEKFVNDNKIIELLEKTKLLENEIATIKQASSKKHISENNAINEYQAEIKGLKQEIEKLRRYSKELEAESETIKNQLQFKDSNLNAIREANEKLKTELEKTKSAWKQSNVLSLEIEAYEKSLNTATLNLEKKTQLISDLEETIKCQKESTKSLKTQIDLLEKNVESEKAHSQELKQQIDSQHAKLRENEHEKSELQVKIQDLTYETENLKSIVDELRLQLSEIACEKDKLCFSFENEKEQLVRQVAKLEKGLDCVSSQLKLTENELEAVRVEYANYKVRAQSILRQNQYKETSRERELEEEVTNMQSTIETLNIKMNTLMETADNYEKKMEELKQDNERVQKRCRELIDLLEESRGQNESLLNENKKQCLEYQESLRAHRLQIETITNCYKKHVQDLESKHINEIEDLKKRCSSANDSTPLTRIGPFGKSKVTDEQKIDLILMEREDAEGSETTSIPKRQNNSKSKHDLIPLDELLNSSLEDRDTERPDSPTGELRLTREKLQVHESRVRHLTSLLAETEQDLAKLTQMNEVLKEEVRRHERAVEREQHIHNSEYLKNVILKFLTLNSGDERTRLVPVLNTILKLSPEETQAVQNVAKGSEIIQRSWGSYLPIWSNHQ